MNAREHPPETARRLTAAWQKPPLPCGFGVAAGGSAVYLRAMASKLGKDMVQRLLDSKLFQDYQHAFSEATRLPLSFHPVEALTGAVVIPALAFLIPIHVAVLGLVLTIMTVMGVGNHMGWEMFPRALVHGPVGRWLITATHHEQHHAAYRGNYGLYFRFWDKICGTDIGLGSFAAAHRRRGCPAADS